MPSSLSVGRTQDAPAADKPNIATSPLKDAIGRGSGPYCSKAGFADAAQADRRQASIKALNKKPWEKKL
jgi:hypothetical protein